MPPRTLALLSLSLLPGLMPGISRAQAVPRTDTPRAGTLRVTFEPIITTWEREFTSTGRTPIGAALSIDSGPAMTCSRPTVHYDDCRFNGSPVFVRAERRETPLIVEFGLTNRVAVSARLPLVRVRVQQQHDDTSAAGRMLDSLLSDSTYAFAPIQGTSRRLRYFSGDAELQAKYRILVGANSATSLAFVVRLPTGHQDSPNDLFDLSTGDHQTDFEIQGTQELIVWNRLWLNASLRLTRQQAGTRERRIGPQDQLLIPHAATARLDWRPGDYAAIDVAPMYRFSRFFGAGFTAGYFTKRRDHYAFRSAQDSLDVAARLGAPISASILDAGTSERRVRLGAAVTYVSPVAEGSLSFEQTVSGAGGHVPAATVFRIVMRTSRWPF